MRDNIKTCVRETTFGLIEAFISAVVWFLVMFIISGALFLYLTLVVPPVLWIGRSLNAGNANWQDGGWVLSFFHNEFITFVVLPIGPLVIGFLIFSAIVWIGFRKMPALSRQGFVAVVASLIALSLFILLPTRSDYFAHQVEEARQSEAVMFNRDNYVRLGNRADFENLKIYRVLHEAGIATWRSDPLAVTAHELREGDLRGLSEDDDELALLWVINHDDGDVASAEVELKNFRVHKRISLESFWQDDHQVWAVSGYRDAPEDVLKRLENN
ncbi:MAG: hypothetical protein V1738_02130 [Patescibacteria group bacterium]